MNLIIYATPVTVAIHGKVDSLGEWDVDQVRLQILLFAEGAIIFIHLITNSLSIELKSMSEVGSKYLGQCDRPWRHRNWRWSGSQHGV